jgi:aldehyde:ferredoxin oxidoreductase
MTIEGEEQLHRTPPLKKILAEFFSLRGWDEQGSPTLDTMKRYAIEKYI